MKISKSTKHIGMLLIANGLLYYFNQLKVTEVNVSVTKLLDII